MSSSQPHRKGKFLNTAIAPLSRSQAAEDRALHEKREEGLRQRRALAAQHSPPTAPSQARDPTTPPPLTLSPSPSPPLTPSSSASTFTLSTPSSPVSEPFKCANTVADAAAAEALARQVSKACDRNLSLYGCIDLASNDIVGRCRRGEVSAAGERAQLLWLERRLDSEFDPRVCCGRTAGGLRHRLDRFLDGDLMEDATRIEVEWEECKYETREIMRRCAGLGYEEFDGRFSALWSRDGAWTKRAPMFKGKDGAGGRSRGLR